MTMTTIKNLRLQSFNKNKKCFIPTWAKTNTNVNIDGSSWEQKVQQLSFGNSLMYTGNSPFTAIEPFSSVRQGDVIYRIAPNFLEYNSSPLFPYYNLFLKTSQPKICGYTMSIINNGDKTDICFNLSENLLLDGTNLNFNFILGPQRWIGAKNLESHAIYHLILSDTDVCKEYKGNKTYAYFKGGSLIWILYKTLESSGTNLFKEEIFCDATSQIVSSKKPDRSNCIKMLFNYPHNFTCDLTFV